MSEPPGEAQSAKRDAGRERPPGEEAAGEEFVLPADRRRDNLQYGLFLLIVVGVFLWASTGVRRAGTTNHRDPGPLVFPVAICAALAAAGVVLLARSALAPAGPADRAGRGSTAPAERQQHGSLRRPLLTLTGVVLCTSAIPWAGFASSAFVFSLLTLRGWGASWAAAAGASAGMLAVIHVLFVQVFRVLLPTGPLGF